MDALRHYAELLLRWNERLNLTGAGSAEEVFARHIDDALSLLPIVEGVQTLVDLGTGAGLPGIPLKIRYPKMRVVLVDATRKKIAFCQEAIRQLQLRDIEAVWGRAEDERIQQKLGRFDLVVSRATWRLCDYLPIALRYVSAKGAIVAMKGRSWAEEVEESKNIIDNNGLLMTRLETKDDAFGTNLVFVKDVDKNINKIK